MKTGRGGLVWQCTPPLFDRWEGSPVQADDDSDNTAPPSIARKTAPSARRRLRLQEAAALTLLGVIMAGAWVVTLSG
jgi:hypothetical protein